LLTLRDHHLDPALPSGFDARDAGVEVDHQTLAAHDVAALADDDVAAEDDRTGTKIVDAAVAARGLILLRHDHAAARLELGDLAVAGGSRRVRARSAGGGARRRVRVIAHDERTAADGGVALHDVNVAAEGRRLVLVADLEALRAYLHRLVAAE